MLTKFLDDVVAKFIKTATSQEEKGIEKYGHAVDPMDEKNYDWLAMAEEEMIDAFKYFHAETVRRDTILRDVIAELSSIADAIIDDPKKKGLHGRIFATIRKLRSISKNLQ